MWLFHSLNDAGHREIIKRVREAGLGDPPVGGRRLVKEGESFDEYERRVEEGDRTVGDWERTVCETLTEYLEGEFDPEDDLAFDRVQVDLVVTPRAGAENVEVVFFISDSMIREAEWTD